MSPAANLINRFGHRSSWAELLTRRRQTPPNRWSGYPCCGFVPATEECAGTVGWGVEIKVPLAIASRRTLTRHERALKHPSGP